MNLGTVITLNLSNGRSRQDEKRSNKTKKSSSPQLTDCTLLGKISAAFYGGARPIFVHEGIAIYLRKNMLQLVYYLNYRSEDKAIH